jgi:hypothetical protein
MVCHDATVHLFSHLKSCLRVFITFPQLAERVGEVFVCLFLHPNALKMPAPATAMFFSLANLFFLSFLVPTFLSMLGSAPVVGFYLTNLSGQLGFFGYTSCVFSCNMSSASWA